MKFIKNLFKQNTVIKEKQKWIKFFRKELSFYVNQSMAKCTLKGTFTAAKLKSFNVTLLHINLLKFLYYDIMNNKPNRVKSITKTKPFETFFKTNDSFKTSSYFPVRLNINLNEKTYFETKAAKSFSKILKKEIYDDVENRILSSINWAVSSIEKMPTASDESNFFDSSVYMTPSKHLLSQCLLNIMIAFETLLLFNDERNKKELLKYRSLSLLENTDFRDSFITEQISNAYKLRSEIVHEGKFNQSPKSVFQLY
ncbi:MAG: HEPN domain-containing protein, partial [Candidatus Cloacimonadota bacterium]|nr:HEPN domain-containing protein [Candidatus Cloacimonadota bacterium]